MENSIATLKQFALEEQGVTSIEYALLGAVIAVVCVGMITATGTNVNVLYSAVCNAVSNAISGSPAC
jgi:pilus assembly protein Flp/PilA